jgi:hypothetical protein
VPNEQLDGQFYGIHFGTHTWTVPEGDFELLPEETNPWGDLFEGRFEGAATFQKLLTRLRRPPSRVASSFGTARAKLHPYQFKPLLKFLDNPNQPILIADDVGLRKTVEAGYILKELKARHGLERVLVVGCRMWCKEWLKVGIGARHPIEALLHSRHNLGTDAMWTPHDSGRFSLPHICESRRGRHTGGQNIAREQVPRAFVRQSFPSGRASRAGRGYAAGRRPIRSRNRVELQWRMPAFFRRCSTSMFVEFSSAQRNARRTFGTLDGQKFELRLDLVLRIEIRAVPHFVQAANLGGP